MLAGIGVLIVVGQFHVLFDHKPLSSGLENLAAMPGRLLGLSSDLRATELAFMIALLTIGGMVGWEKFRPKSLRLVPGALVGVVAATLLTVILGLDVAKVVVPESIIGAITPPENGFLGRFAEPAILTAAVAIACLLYTSPSPRDRTRSRMPSSA